jgi:hypothetical protein
MSVQIDRKGNHVSIKNRYNNTVNSPDATLGNNLDKLKDGLRPAVYNLVDRLDLLRDMDVPIADNYIADNDGGIHPYNYERNNIYYGWYEKISQGEVTSLSESEYFRLAPAIYIKRSASGEIVSLDDRQQISYETSVESVENGYKISCRIDNRPIVTFHIIVDEKQRQQGLEVVIESSEFDNVDIIRRNNSLTSLTLAEGTRTGYIWHNDSLTSLVLAEGTRTGDIWHNNSLTSLTLAEGVQTGAIYGNDSLTSLTLAEGARTGDIRYNDSLTSLTLAEGAQTRDIWHNNSLTSLTLAEGVQTGAIRNNNADLDIVRTTKNQEAT